MVLTASHDQGIPIRLLVVDDDKHLCENLKTVFERRHYRVEMAHEGAAALRKLSAFHPHLMFLDVGLPGLSGIEVLKAAKKIDPTVRVIMLTGQTEGELDRQSRVLGADDYVTKPFTLEYLQSEVIPKLQRYLMVELRSTSVDLAVEREKLELVFEQMQDGIVLFDMSEFAGVANPAARNWLRLPDSPLHVKASDVFRDFNRIRETPDGPLIEKQLVSLEECRLPSVDLVRDQPGHLILECRIRSLISRDKQKSGYMAMLRDVTWERKSLNAMSKFVSSMNHKLRTPLVAIQAFPTFMFAVEDKINPMNETQRKAWLTVREQSERLLNSLTETLAFASIDKDALNHEEVTSLQILEDSLGLLPENVRNRPIVLDTDSCRKLPAVYVDRALLAQAFRHLIENAFKFGATNLKIAGESNNGFVEITFADNGPGIPPEDKDRIFEKFYQVERGFCGQVPGAGLGLTIVRQTVEAHGGRAWLLTTSGSGSTFGVRLPIKTVPFPL
jgi:two-component system phosphate regulon sensor histidine kinase PhoR